MDDELLAEQRAFYRARAPEYDEWWLRQGRYDHGPDELDQWYAQVGVLEKALESFSPSGAVFELAGGTGWWTQHLAQYARHLTVVDSSPETLELNRTRVQRDDVDYVVADIFNWQPARDYDVVFFSFWLSHVPRARFSSFWSLVRSCLRPNGRVFLIDNRQDPSRPAGGDPFVLEYDDDMHLRTLSDGSQFRVVKVMYEPDELERRIEAEGWTADIDATPWFIFGSAIP